MGARKPLATCWEKTVLVRAGVPLPSPHTAGRELLLPGHEGKQMEEASEGSGRRRGEARGKEKTYGEADCTREVSVPALPCAAHAKQLRPSCPAP